MQVRNLLIAAGAVLAATTAIAAAPTAASAQEFYHPYRGGYHEVYRDEGYRPYRAYGYGYGGWEAHRYWEHRRYEDWRFHHRPFYRGY